MTHKSPVLSCGLQCWTVRDLLNSDPSGTLTQCDAFDFFELAGTGDLTCRDLSVRLSMTGCTCVEKIKGAHICSLGAKASDVADTVLDYLRAFPTIEWVAFFFHPGDTSSFEGSAASREKLFGRYSQHLESYKNEIEARFLIENAEENHDPVLRVPDVVYHTYAPDFYPGSDGEPIVSQLVHHDGLQLDNYFASLVGMNLGLWLQETNNNILVHSVHITGIDDCGLHDRVPQSSANSDAQVELRRLISACAALVRPCARFLIEHEINPNSKHEALDSLGRFRSYTI